MTVATLLPIVGLAALSVIARIVLGSWIAPGAFFLIFWTILITVSVVAVQEYKVWHIALWWIFASLFLFFMGSCIGNMIACGKRVAPLEGKLVASQKQLIFPKLNITTLICTLLGFSYVLFRDLFAPTIMSVPPLWFQALLSFLYAAPLFGGIMFASTLSRPARLLAIMSVSPAVFFSVIDLGRSPMLAAVFFWIAGFWSAKVLIGRGVVPLCTPKLMLTTLLLAVTLIGAGMFIAPLRIIGVENEWSMRDRLVLYPDILCQVDPVKEFSKFRHCVFSSPFAFSYYLKKVLLHPPTPSHGAIMFGGPLQLFGVHMRTPFESFEVDPNVYSNVYSLFMPPIEDFGLYGSFVAFFFCGLITGWAYRLVAKGNLLAIPILTMFYPHVLVIGGYYFVYNSLILAHTILGIYLFWVKKKVRILTS